MWNLDNTPPAIIEAEVWSSVPPEFGQPRPSDWSTANKFGDAVASFLEGPSFDRQGNLYVTDIPFGRIFRISPAGAWHLVTQYDGWPNGIAIHKDGRLFIADYRRGLICMDPVNGAITPLLAHRNSESFKGLNDLTFDAQGQLYFTDQGQTGLHDPTGRVYRLDPDARLTCLLANAPSPNGIALDAEERTLFVAVTRANQGMAQPVDGRRQLVESRRLAYFFRLKRTRWHGAGQGQQPGGGACQPWMRVRVESLRRSDPHCQEPRRFDNHQPGLRSGRTLALSHRIGIRKRVARAHAQAGPPVVLARLT